MAVSTYEDDVLNKLERGSEPSFVGSARHLRLLLSVNDLKKTLSLRLLPVVILHVLLVVLKSSVSRSSAWKTVLTQGYSVFAECEFLSETEAATCDTSLVGTLTTQDMSSAQTPQSIRDESREHIRRNLTCISPEAAEDSGSLDMHLRGFAALHR